MTADPGVPAGEGGVEGLAQTARYLSTVPRGYRATYFPEVDTTSYVPVSEASKLFPKT